MSESHRYRVSAADPGARLFEVSVTVAEPDPGRAGILLSGLDSGQLHDPGSLPSHRIDRREL